MTLRDAVMFLIGDRRAILAIAGSRGALLVGFLLVLTGSLARNYDGAYLIVEADVLTHGVAAATLNATLLFSLTYFTAWCHQVVRPPFISGWLSFLGLFWMTAPMAWLYAMPVERWMSPEDAVRANATMLVAVSIWRVLLITRVLSVVWNSNPVSTFFLVMLFAHSTLLTAMMLSPAPVINFMGGMSRSPAEELLALIQFAAIALAVLTSPVSLIGGLIAMFTFAGEWKDLPPRATSRGAFAFAGAALAIWIGLAAWMMPERRLVWSVDSLFAAGQVEESLRLLADQPRSKFPPHYRPPPHSITRMTATRMQQVREVLAVQHRDAWFRPDYLEMSWSKLARQHFSSRPLEPDEILSRLGHLHSEWPLTPEQRAGFEFHLEQDERFTDSDRQSLRKLLEWSQRENDRHLTAPKKG